MFASVLGVEDVLVNDEGRAASLTRIAAEKLTDYRNVHKISALSQLNSPNFHTGKSEVNRKGV